ncbi:glycosyltransferase family 9 protein [Candidatus Omnitrophota bacterium]
MNRILIVNLGGMGDFLLSTPALRALRNRYPQSEIDILITTRIHKLPRSLTYIDKVFTFDMDYGGTIPFIRFYRNVKSLLTLRRKHFDIAINMRTMVTKGSAKKMKILLDIINSGRTAGRDTDGRGYFLDVKIPETYPGTRYEMEYDIDTVKALGAEVSDRTIDFRVNKISRQKINTILTERGIADDVFLVGIHPGGMPSRQWPIDRFAQIIAAINKLLPCKFVITGTKKEAGIVNRLVEITNTEIVNVAGLFDLIELGALVERCNLFITNNTGPMHVAAILNIPLIVIDGPTDIVRFDPRNISDNAIVLHKKVECAPCEKAECEDLQCLKAISPEEVVQAAFHFLKNKGTG